MWPNLTPLPIPPYLLSVLATSSQKKPKQNLTKDAAVCHGVLHSIPFCPDSFPYKCLLQRINSLAQGLWLLLRCWCWVLTRTPLRYPRSPSSCSFDSVGLGYSALQQFIDDIDAGADQLKTLILDLCGSWVGHPTNSLMLNPWGPALLHPHHYWAQLTITAQAKDRVSSPFEE